LIKVCKVEKLSFTPALAYVRITINKPNFSFLLAACC